MTNLRYLKKPDGTLVLQQETCAIYTDVLIRHVKEWQDVPIIEDGEESCTH